MYLKIPIPPLIPLGMIQTSKLQKSLNPGFTHGIPSGVSPVTPLEISTGMFPETVVGIPPRISKAFPLGFFFCWNYSWVFPVDFSRNFAWNSREFNGNSTKYYFNLTFSSV